MQIIEGNTITNRGLAKHCSISGYFLQQQKLIFQGIKVFEWAHYSTLKGFISDGTAITGQLCVLTLPRSGAALTSCWFITIKEELNSVGASRRCHLHGFPCESTVHCPRCLQTQIWHLLDVMVGFVPARCLAGWFSNQN